MAEILNRRTRLRVKEAEEGDRIEPHTVYGAPPDYHLLVNPDGTLSLPHSELVHFVRPSADLLFESVAASFKDRAIAVVLTGSGSDGAMGVQAIKKMGGTVIAQDEDSSEFFGMLAAAIKTKTVDFILPLGEIADALGTLMKGESTCNRGFDFTAYKRSTLQRRIEKRMQAVEAADLVDYVDYLEVHPGEFTFLFNIILINVTEFFRDAPAWQFLAAEVIPRIIGGKDASDSIRVWSAGYASGEEADSVAMLFAEALGIEQLRSRVKIYATDVDDDALNAARLGTYSNKAFENVPGPLVEKYFDQEGDRYSFHKEARRAVIFCRHDLIQDPPISRVDLLLRRNTLMYFNNESQARILARFHFALNNGGLLFAGRAEMLLTHGNIFAPLDLKRRIFMKVPKDALPDRFAMLAQANHVDGGVRSPGSATSSSLPSARPSIPRWSWMPRATCCSPTTAPALSSGWEYGTRAVRSVM